MSTSLDQIEQQINEGFARIDSKAVVMHTDLNRIKFFQRGSPLRNQMSDLFQVLIKSSSGRAMLFPTFNNNFLRTGVYDPLNDPSEVGALNEYVRQLYPKQRTLTPACSFCIYNNNGFLLEPVENVFSKESTFGELVKYDSTVVFLGAPFSSNTFLHHIEEVLDIGYRYIKPFAGVINRDEGPQQFVLQYRVRPHSGSVDYDWDRLVPDLIDQKVLHELPLGQGKFSWFRARDLMDYWGRRMKEDEMYILTPDSRKKTQELYAQYGEPLRYALLERAAKI
jgi:aminoglycoside N3'-acetyltransferase